MKPILLLLLASALAGPALAQQAPTTTTGAIGNETLVANKDVANAQAVGVITKFMSEGAQTCDAEGKNCRSLFGANDSFDFTTAQQQVQSTTGIQAFSFMEGDDGTSIAAQTSTLVLACADRAVKTLSGIAFKALGCQVNTEGDVTLQYQVCTAPSRGNPVTQPENAVWCSTDPTHPSYRPPAGKVCLRAACDTEPVNSLNGWSAAQTITWEASLPASASASQRTNNGLGLTFYPPLNGSVSPSFKAGSDNMTAVKVVESYLNTTTNQGAVALKVAFRHKATVTKEMLTSGSASVPDPSAHTAHWDTLLKLQDNPLIPQYQQKFAQNGSECIQQIQNGISKDGKISVCDPDFVGESGVRPIQKTAQVGAQGQACSTTAQCLEEVVNTNTWRESCQADVPLAMRSCSTTQDYQMVDIHSTRKRSQDICREKRTTAQYACTTQSVLVGAAPKSCPAGTVLVNKFGPNACTGCIDNYQTYKVICQPDNKVRIRWWSAMSNGSEYSEIVDRTITVKAFENSYNELGPFCYDGSGTVPFQVACTGTTCTYTSWITGNCNGAKFGLRETGIADVSYDGIFSTVNNCSTYENAR